MNNPPAFPHTVEYRGSDCGGIVPHGGMTLRDYFAAKAMQAMTHRGDGDMYFCSAQAYKMADAMMKAREA
jgi:hypothetical protein